jgi:phosphatidylglycerol:prolipoprotein diacylglycerol transferase
VLTPSPSLGTNYYLENPIRIFEIWNGGLGIYGALLGGVIGAWFYLRRHDQSLLVWLDIIAPAVAIGQGIGRWANFVNQELYGAPTTLPWALYIEPAKRLPGYTQFETFHPLFLYESLWNFAAGVILLIVAHRLHGWLKRGDLVLLYLMEYATIRFLLDFVRLDSNMSGLVTLTTAQVVSLMTFVVAIAVLIWRHRPQRQAVA